MSQSKKDLKNITNSPISTDTNGDNGISYPEWDSAITPTHKDNSDSPKPSKSSSATKKTSSKSTGTKSSGAKTTKSSASKTASGKTTKKTTTKSGTASKSGATKATKAKSTKASTSKTTGSKTSSTKSGSTRKSSASKTTTKNQTTTTLEKEAILPQEPIKPAPVVIEVPKHTSYPSMEVPAATSTEPKDVVTPAPTSHSAPVAPVVSAAVSTAATKKELHEETTKQISRRSHSDSGKKADTKSKKKGRKKRKHPILRALFTLFFCAMLLGGGVAFYYVYSVISETPPIDPNNINDLLSETTIMYDANGNEMDTIFSGTNREIASIQNMPKHLTDAFIALEDKTFRTHHGFNFTRIIGALLDAVLGGGRISGTSTITQQLARNVFLQDTQFDYSIKRKIAEAYYSLKIEKALSKDEIIEAYLNTIYFGYGSWGIETAAQAYFQKDVSQLTIAESAALASLPQLPNEYQFVDFIDGGTAAQYADIALKETSDGVYVVNDLSRERRRACLSLMLEQELITQAEYDQAINVELKDMLNPDFTTYNLGYTSYFADYVISDVIKDLQEEKGMDYDSAWRMLYQGGLSIYSTMDPVAQKVIADEFSDPSNYPSVNPLFDDNDNAITSDGYVIMFAYDNIFDEDGNHIIPPDNYERLADGTMIIYYGRNLHIYETYVGDSVDYSLEFPSMYDYDEDWNYYTIPGGFINIPMNYKSANSDGDLIIKPEFFTDFPDFFIFNEDGSCTIPPSSYTLGQKTIQPQSAMTIIENKTGNIIAMVGGRSASGRQIFNRAISPRQSGSSIKPLSVYSAALQQSVDEMKEGKTHENVNYGIDKQGSKYYGSYMTAASIVVDEKLTINGEAWPKNDDGTFSGMQTLRSAMTDSLNTCAVKIWMQVGVDYSLQHVKKFGITTLVEEGGTNDLNPGALALGGQTRGVTTLEMASAFTAFPNNGVRYEPSSYTKVIDRHGNVILENNPEPQQVMDPGVAWIMTDMLHDVVTHGTGPRANFDTFVAGKTGTTDNEFDIWFDGFTNNYTASLWIGSDINARLSSKSGMAAALWGRIMSQLEGSYLGERAPMPDNVIVYNGEYFVDGTQKGAPSKKDLMKKVKICKETKLLATPLCKDCEEIEIFLLDEEEKKNQEEENEKIPTKYCYLHNDDPEKYPTTEEGEKHIEEEQKKKDDRDAADTVKALIKALPSKPGVGDEAAINKARAAYDALTKEQKKLVDDSKLVAAEKALAAAKKADDAARKEEEARKAEEAAYNAWLAERENHKVWIVDIPASGGVDEVLYTQEDYDQYLADHDEAPPWKVGDVKTPAVPPTEEQGHWEYEKGWRDGDFTYP